MPRIPTITGTRSPIQPAARMPVVQVPRAPGSRLPTITPQQREQGRYAGATRIDQIPWTYTPQSSWVVAFRYLASKLLLHIMFKSGAICEYAGISPDKARRLRDNKSKGKTVWREFYHWPYRLVRNGTSGRGRFKTRGRFGKLKRG